MLRPRAQLIRSVAVAALSALLLQTGLCARLADGLPRPPAPETVIFAGQAWYLDRPEPEQVWTGVLEARQVAPGPNTRDALTYALVTAEGALPVYAAGVADVLGRYAGRPVQVTGRWVDLSAEGFGPELWIGSLRPAE